MSASDFVLLFLLLLAIVAIAVACVGVLLLRLLRGNAGLARGTLPSVGYTMSSPPASRLVLPAPSGVSAPAVRGGQPALQAQPPPSILHAAPRAPRVNTYGELED